MNPNIILNTDSYKTSHYLQYPPNTSTISSYIESRGGDIDETVFFGLQMYIMKYLLHPFTQSDIDQAESILKTHGVPFNKEGWQYILARHKGFLPMSIQAVDEGTVVPTGNVLVQAYNTDPKCAWLTSYLETSLLRAVWYPTTVATRSREIKKIIKKYLELTGTPEDIDFKLHDFGARGVSSMESAEIGGLAHLINFKGTDTLSAIMAGRKYYDEDMAGFSIPAAEHSTITCWGKENESKAYENMIDQFSGEGKLVAVVSDSYDIFNACRFIWGEGLKQKVINNGGTIVVRPDCYDDKTQLFTNSGWKYFDELNSSDLVAQVFDDGHYEFTKPINYIEQDYDGDMIHFKDRKGKVDLLVTPNHRVVKENSNGKKIIEEAQDIKFYYGSNLIRSSNAKAGKKILSTLDRLKIAFQADGSFPSKGRGIRFSFSKKRKIERLTEICKKLGVIYDIYKLAGGSFEINIKADDRLFDKNLDWVDLENLEVGWCMEFIEELSYWDATRRSDKRFKFDTTNEKVIDVVEIIAISAGYGVLIAKRTDDRKEIFSDVYTANILKDNLCGGQSVRKEVVKNYKGKVYCVTVPTGMLMVKRNRATCVSGNSGDPVTVLSEVFGILMQQFGFTMNDKGYRVLPDYIRVIQGDGVNMQEIENILDHLEDSGISADNIAFGMGGEMLQRMDRDTHKFAMKASYAVIDGKDVDVYKDPVTDPGKQSKKGLLGLYKDGDRLFTDRYDYASNYPNQLKTVFEDGALENRQSFREIRIRASV